VDKLPAGGRGMGGGWPIIDGYVIPDDQYKLYEARRYNDTPILVGYNSDEGASFSPPATPQDYSAAVKARYGPHAESLLKAYLPGPGPVPAKTARDFTRDAAFGWATWSWARLQKQTGKAAIFLYYFDEHPSYPADSPRAGYGTPHSEELPYVFHQLREHNRPAPTATDERLSAMLRSYWTNFAKAGNPNGNGLPPWPSFRDAPRMLHIAAADTRAGPIVNEGGLQSLDDYFAWRRSGNPPDLRARH